MENFFFLVLISFSITFFILFVSKKYSLLVYKSNEAHKEIFENYIYIIGGVIIFFLITIFFFSKKLNLNFFYYIFFLIIFIIGLTSDIIKFDAKNRLILIFAFSLITLLITKDYIYDFKFTLLNIFFSKYTFIATLFTAICLATLINGMNFLDGSHGLVIIYNLLVIIFLNIFLKIILNINSNSLIILNTLTPTLILLLYLNLKEQIFLGDSGSYLLGAILGYSIIEISQNLITSFPYIYATFLIYPAFEVFFSIFRKIISNKNPFSPDREHIHQLCEKAISIRLSLNKKKSKIFSSLLINLYILFFFITSILLYKYKWFLILNIFLFCIVYIFVYIKLKKLIL